MYADVRRKNASDRCTTGRLSEPAPQVGNVGPVHLSVLHRSLKIIKGNQRYWFPYFFGSPHAPITELFDVFDDFPIHQFRKNLKPVIGIGLAKKIQFVTRKLRHPNHLKRAMYYHELLENDHVESKTALAKKAGISRTQTRLILQMLKLDEKIKDFILKIDDTDPELNCLTAYRLQPLFRIQNKERQRREFWKMIEGQYPDQSARYEQSALSRLDS